MRVFKSEQGRQAVYTSYNKLIQAWDIPVEERDIDTAYGQTHVIQAGPKTHPPLLLFHGVGDNSALMWIKNAKALAQHYHFIAVDAIGGAGKSRPDQRYGKGFDLTTWFNALLQALKIDKTDLVGVSYGCYLAQHFLITCPDRVGKVVGIAGYPNVQGYKMGLMKRMMTIFLPVMLWPTEKRIQKLFKTLAGPDADVILADKELYRHWRLLLKYFRNDSLRFHKRLAFSPAQYQQVKDRLLFLVGDQDRMAYFPESMRAIQELGLQLQIIPNSGHSVNYDKATEVNIAILCFLNQKQTAPAKVG